MAETYYFFANREGNTFRILREYNSGFILVVKVFVDSGVSTVKVWQGSDRNSIVKYWNMSPVIPSTRSTMELVQMYKDAVAQAAVQLDIAARQK